MPSRKFPLVTNQIYHVINRGVDKRPIFNNYYDYLRFTRILAYYQRNESLRSFSILTTEEVDKILSIPSKERLVEIICYCLLPNHFHLLLKQTVDNGISRFLRLISDSYTRYFNSKNKRRGILFEGPFRSVLIEDDNQLLHVSRYIHLNPVVSYLTKNLNNYRWSSYTSYIKPRIKSIIKYQSDLILEHFSTKEDYQQFVLDHRNYAQQLEKIKHLILE